MVPLPISGLFCSMQLKANASGIIICHNHPSGNVQPSESDLSLTKKIKEAASLMDVQLLDHLIIIPEGGYYSVADEGIIYSVTPKHHTGLSKKIRENKLVLVNVVYLMKAHAGNAFDCSMAIYKLKIDFKDSVN